MYLRFITTGINHESNVRDGIFGGAWHLRQKRDFPEADETLLWEHLDWMNRHMEIPTRFNRTKSKAHAERAAKGISWFKDTAVEHIGRAHQIAAILHRHGIPIEIITTDRPGYIVYEDAHQVVAEPFRDTKVG